MLQGSATPPQLCISSSATHVTSISITEPVTPVNQTCLKKAITPPVTIKNFFKPAKVPPSEAHRGRCNDTPAEKSEVVCSGSKTLSNGIETKSHKIGKQKRPLPESIGNRSKVKRAKQSSIASLFTKGNGSERKEGAKRTRECPVCSIEFESSSSNIDINKHIDSCLIE